MCTWPSTSITYDRLPAHRILSTSVQACCACFDFFLFFPLCFSLARLRFDMHCLSSPPPPSLSVQQKVNLCFLFDFFFDSACANPKAFILFARSNPLFSFFFFFPDLVLLDCWRCSIPHLSTPVYPSPPPPPPPLYHPSCLPFVPLFPQFKWPSICTYYPPPNEILRLGGQSSLFAGFFSFLLSVHFGHHFLYFIACARVSPRANCELW